MHRCHRRRSQTPPSSGQTSALNPANTEGRKATDLGPCDRRFPAAGVALADRRDQGFETVIVLDELSSIVPPAVRSTGKTTPSIVIVPTTSAVRFRSALCWIVIVNGP